MEYLSETFPFILGVIGTYIGLHWKVKKDLEAEYDKDLRHSRLEVYRNLWRSLQPLAKYVPDQPVTYKIARQLSTDLHKGYFEEGGTFLSENARNAFFRLLDLLTGLPDASDRKGNDSDKLDASIFKDIRDAGSALRSALARDVGTRKAPILNHAD